MGIASLLGLPAAHTIPPNPKQIKAKPADISPEKHMINDDE
jgi:hypothetical protein